MQTNEMQLYVSLDNQNLTADQRTDIINRIEQIGQTRQTLYNSLNNMASSYQQNVTTSQNTIQQQITQLSNQTTKLQVNLPGQADKYN